MLGVILELALREACSHENVFGNMSQCRSIFPTSLLDFNVHVHFVGLLVV